MGPLKIDGSIPFSCDEDTFQPAHCFVTASRVILGLQSILHPFPTFHNYPKDYDRIYVNFIWTHHLFVVKMCIELVVPKNFPTCHMSANSNRGMP